MRGIFLAILFFFPVLSSAATLEEDKVKHGSISMAFGAMATSTMEEVFPKVSRSKRWLAGTTLAMVPGVAKEMVDERFDRADLAADLLGSVVGVLLMDLTGGRVLFQVSEDKVFIGLRFGAEQQPLRPPDVDESLRLSQPIVAMD